jgi:hypothetical protein
VNTPITELPEIIELRRKGVVYDTPFEHMFPLAWGGFWASELRFYCLDRCP